MKRFVKFFSSIIVISVSLLLFVNVLSKRGYTQKVYSSEEDTYWDITHVSEFPKVDGTIYDIALSADESILYVGGDFGQIGDVGGSGTKWTRDNLAAIDTQTYEVLDWAPSASGPVRTIEVYGESIYIGGSFYLIGETYTGEFAKIDSNGQLDMDCMPNINTYLVPCTVYSIQISDDFIYVGGSFDRIGTGENEEEVTGLVRLSNNSSCTWDESWTPSLSLGSGWNPTVYAMDIYRDDLYIGGSFDSIGGTYTGEFAKIDSNGQLDMDCMPYINMYNPYSGTFTVHSIQISDDFIYVGGSFNRIGRDENEEEVTGLVRLSNNSSCTWDESWTPSFVVEPVVFSLSFLGDDVLVGGSFEGVGGQMETEFALLDVETAQGAPYWNPRINSESVYFTVYASTVGEDRVYVGGSFKSVLGSMNSSDYGLAAFDYSLENVETVEIDTIEDLDGIRDNLVGKNYILTKDLDFKDCGSYENCDNMNEYISGAGWEPIGSVNLDDLDNNGFFMEEDAFTRNFDGQGHTISNLYINRSDEETVGLFGALGTASEVKNVGLLDVNVSGPNFVGGLAGVLMGRIENSYTTGDVVGNSEEFTYGGGLVGFHFIESVSPAPVPCTILNSYSRASVSGFEVRGGLVGENAGDIINSYSTGDVTGTESGGLIGLNEGGDILNSFWDTETSGQLTSDRGTGKTTLEMKSIATFNDIGTLGLENAWDISSVHTFNPESPSTWYISDENDYPKLYWEYVTPSSTTGNAIDITKYTATVTSTIESIGTIGTAKAYFEYRPIGGTWISTEKVTKSEIGQNSQDLTQLLLNTEYEYRSVLEYGTSFKVYGLTETFTTQPDTTLPTPSIRITDLGLIDDIPDRENLTYYFTSTRPVIKGVTEPSSNITFEYNGNTYTSKANSLGEFTITLTVSNGTNRLEYYSTDLSGNNSSTRVLSLVVGTENFPDWLLEKMGLITREKEEVQEDETEEPIDEEINDEEMGGADDEDTSTQGQSQKIVFRDSKGESLAEAIVEIEGKTYTTNSEGEIEVKDLENRKYIVKIKTKDGKEYSVDIFGIKDKNDNILVEVKDDLGTDNIWIKVLMFGGIGLVVIISLVIFLKGKRVREDV